MPELPDLHVFAGNLRKRVLDQPIVSFDIYNRSKINAAAEDFARATVGASIVGIAREGKELFFTLDNGNAFSVHLMLSGRFLLCDFARLSVTYQKIFSVSLEGGLILAATDYRGMCRLSLNPKASGGPDALSEEFTYAYFSGAAKKKAGLEAKAFLIDQRILKGIGNAYADEILWKALIAPDSVMGSIPEDRLRALYDAIPAVLRDAIAQIERIAPDAIGGEERGFLGVHNSKKKRTDEGDPIMVKTVASKTTYYTEKQIRYI